MSLLFCFQWHYEAMQTYERKQEEAHANESQKWAYFNLPRRTRVIVYKTSAVMIRRILITGVTQSSQE